MEFLQNFNVQLYILSFLLGGVPFGLLLAKYYAKVDIKKAGSGSIGATNVLRVVKEQDPELAKKLSIATMALDAAKAALPLLAAKLYGIDDAVLWGMAVIFVLGHCFSPYLMFEGGKGVATSFGALLVMLPVPAVVGFVGWFAAAKLLKVSSLSSLIGLFSVLAASYALYSTIEPIGTRAPLLVIAFIVVYKHIPNIARLLSHQEAKVV